MLNFYELFSISTGLILSQTGTKRKRGITDKSTEVQNLNFKKSNNDTSRSSETELQEVQNVNLQKYNKQTFGGSEIEPTEVQKLVPNYTNYNQANPNHTEESYIYPINPSEAMETEDNTIDVMDDAQAYISLIMLIWICDGKSQYLREPRLLWKEIIYLRPLEGM